MARGQRRSIDDKIQSVDLDIKRFADRLKSLESERDELLKQKREEEMAELYNTIEDSGLSMDEVIALVQSSNINVSAKLA